jgi:putative endonuclease
MGQGNRMVGKIGETIAQGHLRRNGYAVIGKNLRTPFGELDIVAKRNGIIVFVEVKTRLTDSLGPPYISVTRNKLRHIVMSSMAYLKQHGLSGCDWRVDIISVKLSSGFRPENIEIIENAAEDHS